MTKVALEALGCKLNQAETEALAHQLLSKGYQLTESVGEADVYVLNTCTVTHIADRKARHLLRSARRSNPRALIIAVGCYAQRVPEELRRLGAADLILSNEGSGHLTEIIGSIGGTRQEEPTNGYNGCWNRTRSLVKIQEGCNDYCSFCVVPYTRGRERSLPVEEILQEVKARAAAGYKEVVLTGTKIGGYRWNGQSSQGLAGLINHILNETGIERLRLSSLQPQDLTPELVRLWADNRLCPHLHIPLQSGSEAILRRMNRQYSVADYERAVCSVREAISDLAVTTDILVGFPGEGEREFEESYCFCERMGFANIHVFPYSARPSTAASVMPDRVEGKVKKERSQRMLTLARQSAERFRHQFLGRTMTVLWENRSDRTIWDGLTANYLRVFASSSQDLSNRLLAVTLVADSGHGFLGEITDGGWNG